ncbi:PREDICTED: histone-lysine N-methyltransferase setd3, partial [Ceratosolen solmsi marchali]|uniref:protein-histidine N-methyltransferase n=1 Tax=Ceratosolen solmsi marchali TaxID=326594 RepID=A0AAJ6YT92_9HYME
NQINLECEKLFHICSDPSYLNRIWDNYLEISSILEKIKKLEETEVKSLERIDVIEEFISWLKQHDAKMYGISICEFPNYDLGLKAEIEFKENDIILEIPRKLIFNVHTAAFEIKDIQNDILIKNMPYIGLAIALLIEKNKEQSKWKPYLNILPKNYNTVLYMNINDMMELKDSPNFDAALKQCRNIARQYSYFNKIFQNSKNSVSELLRDTFSYEEYRWAVSTVMTRQNIIPSEDNLQMIHSLIPMWDLCNHEHGKITTNFNMNTNCCECYAMKNFKMGDQIFIHYGSQSNSEFFIHSGFVYNNNKNDSFKLRLSISKVDALQKERKSLLLKVGLSSVNEYLIKPESEPISSQLLGFLRILNMNKKQLDYWIKSSETSDLMNPKSVYFEALDKNVLKYIVTRLKLLLSKYPSSEQNDVKLIENTSQNWSKLVLRMRLCERNHQNGSKTKVVGLDRTTGLMLLLPIVMRIVEIVVNLTVGNNCKTSSRCASRQRRVAMGALIGDMNCEDYLVNVGGLFSGLITIKLQSPDRGCRHCVTIITASPEFPDSIGSFFYGLIIIRLQKPG